MKTKKSNKLYRKARPGWDSKVANRSELAKDDGAKKRKKRKPDKLKGAEILQFSLEGKFLREYSSMIEAGKDLGIDREAIYRCLDGLQKTGGDFQWRYKIDPNFDEGIFDIPPVINIRTFKWHAVVQYNLEGRFVKEYASLKEAAEICGIPVMLIYQCIRRKQQSTYKYQWRLKRDVIKDGKIMDIEPAKKQLGLAVCKFDMDGKFIREYPSMSEAARDEYVSKAAISLRLKRKKCGEYQWRFKGEVVKDGKIIDIGPLKKTGSKQKIKSKYSYPVCQFGKNGTFIREYPSTLEAAKETNIAKYIIFSCAVKKIKSSGDLQWRFKEEVVNKNGKIRDIEPVKTMSPLYFHAVCQFEPDGTFIREYPSIIEAAKKANIIKSGILSCAAKKIKSIGGFKWRFKEEAVKKKKDRKEMAIKRVRRDPSHYFRAVCQFKQDGTLVREYPSINEASKKTNITRSLIFSYASRKAKNRYGYLWRFKEDVVDKDGKILDIDTRKPVPERLLRPVCQFDVDGTFIREYPSILAAANITDISKYSIFLCASKKIKKRDGYQWRFKEDVVKKDGIIKDIEPARPVPSHYLRAVCQFEKNGKFIREYPSILDAANKTEAYREAIYMCVQKKHKTTVGFQWRFKEEVIKKDGKIRDIEPARPVLPHFLPAVCKFGPDGKFIDEYPSISEAEEKTGIYKYIIFMCANKKYKMAFGFQWRYKDDPEFKNGITDIAPYERKKSRRRIKKKE